MVRVLALRFIHSLFLLQLLSLTFLMFILLSFKPPVYYHAENFNTLSFVNTQEQLRVLEPGFLENSVGVNTAGLRSVVSEDEDGKKVVLNRRDKTIDYNIKSGDNVWKIAHKFGLKVQTILWANDLNAKQTLTVGNTLKIPPIDGIFYKVKARETLSEIVKKHGADTKKVLAYNNIKNNVVKIGQDVFIPNVQRIYIAEKPKPHYVAKKYNKYTKGISPYRKYSKSSKSLGNLGIKLIRPTQGVLTQGFHRGHYALDIASARNTPIYASAGGTVRIATYSGWNYGFGRYIVITHGNGVETLYAHNNVVKVKVGQTVKAGQLIALMGNTGNVRGRTGIHVHFELRIRGRKVNPYNYFQ